MKVKYFKEDGTEEIVDLPDEEKPERHQPAEHHGRDVIYTTEQLRQAFVGVIIIVILLTTLVFLGISVYRGIRGC